MEEPFAATFLRQGCTIADADPATLVEGEDVTRPGWPTKLDHPYSCKSADYRGSPYGCKRCWTSQLPARSSRAPCWRLDSARDRGGEPRRCRDPCDAPRLLGIHVRPDLDWPTVTEQIRQLLSIRDLLARILLAIGSAIGVATLATGALRNAVIANEPTAADQFPAIYPLLYGGLFTAILAIVYLPTYEALQRTSVVLSTKRTHWIGATDPTIVGSKDIATSAAF